MNTISVARMCWSHTQGKAGPGLLSPIPVDPGLTQVTAIQGPRGDSAEASGGITAADTTDPKARLQAWEGALGTH